MFALPFEVMQLYRYTNLLFIFSMMAYFLVLIFSLCFLLVNYFIMRL